MPPWSRRWTAGSPRSTSRSRGRRGPCWPTRCRTARCCGPRAPCRSGTSTRGCHRRTAPSPCGPTGAPTASTAWCPRRSDRRRSRDGPVALVVGDIAFLHDLNALVGARLHGLSTTIVLVNNDGGGIFSFLPQARPGIPVAGSGLPEHYEELFGTPHGIDVGPAVEALGGEHQVVGHGDLSTAVRGSLERPGVQVLELRTDRARNLELHREVAAAAARALAGLGALRVTRHRETARSTCGRHRARGRSAAAAPPRLHRVGGVVAGARRCVRRTGSGSSPRTSRDTAGRRRRARPDGMTVEAHRGRPRRRSSRELGAVPATVLGYSLGRADRAPTRRSSTRPAVGRLVLESPSAGHRGPRRSSRPPGRRRDACRPHRARRHRRLRRRPGSATRSSPATPPRIRGPRPAARDPPDLAPRGPRRQPACRRPGLDGAAPRPAERGCRAHARRSPARSTPSAVARAEQVARGHPRRAPRDPRRRRPHPAPRIARPLPPTRARLHRGGYPPHDRARHLDIRRRVPGHPLRALRAPGSPRSRSTGPRFATPSGPRPCAS